MKPLRTWWLNWYVYIVPSIFCIVYFFYVVLGVYSKNSIEWLGDSEGFSEMCRAIEEFSSIVLGIYGFLIPAVIGKQDKFNKKFWKCIDKQKFSKDIQHLVISGVITILLSSGLLIADIFPKKICEIIIGCFFWVLAFYCCSSIRFISIFISLIVEGQENCDENESIDEQEHCGEYEEIKRNLDSKLNKF